MIKVRVFCFTKKEKKNIIFRQKSSIFVHNMFENISSGLNKARFTFCLVTFSIC